MARFKTMRTDPVTDLLIEGDKVVIRWRFTFMPAEGPPMTMEEVTLQRWVGDAIAEERFFFYDPRQTRPPPPCLMGLQERTGSQEPSPCRDVQAWRPTSPLHGPRPVYVESPRSPPGVFRGLACSKSRGIVR